MKIKQGHGTTTMIPPKRQHSKVKAKLHPRNRHRERYDFKALIKSYPGLAPFVLLNKYQDESINFADPIAVKVLNKAILRHFYDLVFWEIPDGFLCPPIPGRADYLHHIADLLAKSNEGKIPRGENVKCLDIGVGANCVYPIIGVKEYGWSFVGSEIDPVSVASAQKIVKNNPTLEGKVEIRLQSKAKSFFRGIIQEGEHFDVSVCNPPFHASMAEAKAASQRKVTNLKGQKTKVAVQNFGGKNRELWTEGGEKQFIQDMITESREFADNCREFLFCPGVLGCLPGGIGGRAARQPPRARLLPVPLD